MKDLFLAFGNLPLHPLAVHFAVALFPIAVMIFMAVLSFKKTRDRYLGVSLIALVATLPLVFIAQQSGEALSEVLYEPEPHAEFGEQLLPLASALTAVAFLTWLSIKKGWKKVFSQVLAVAVMPLGVASLAMTFVVGHSGAEAVWAGKITQNSQQSQPSDSNQDAKGSSYYLSEVSKHNSSADCWVAIDGAVYDLTSFITRHPGGSAVISNLCGTDATMAFQSQHAKQAVPRAELEKLLVGTLVGVESTSKPDQSSDASAIFSASDVLAHASASDCWVVVDGTVYDLSGYSNSHPGGAGNISALCGKDATSAFSSQHGFTGRPADTLAAMAIGKFDSSGKLPATNVTYGDDD